MKVVTFDYAARFGHFLRAEANRNALSYPVPPRTVLLGLVGAILGLEKDAPQVRLGDASLAVAGPVPAQHWHKANLRKDPPAPLPYRVKAADVGTSSEQRNTILPQQWLWRPRYRVWAALPSGFQEELAARLRERRWHFSPCMGLSEMLAEVTWVGECDAQPLPAGGHLVAGVVRAEAVQVNVEAAANDNLAIQTLRMPRAVTPDRVFTHADYLLETRGRAIPVETAKAWKAGEDVLIFL